MTASERAVLKPLVDAAQRRVMEADRLRGAWEMPEATKHDPTPRAEHTILGRAHTFGGGVRRVR